MGAFGHPRRRRNRRRQTIGASAACRGRRFSSLERLEVRDLLSMAGEQLFPADNPWNQNIANAPVAANSRAIMNNIMAGGDGRLHPDFGQDTQSSGPLYGIPYNIVHANTQPKVHVVIDAYPSESDVQDAPIAANAVLEGDLQNGPTVGLANRGDSHLIVFDIDNDIGYEFFGASRPSENADGQWHAAQESVWNMKTDSFRPLDWTSADAAGLPILPGLVRPDEGLPVSQGGQGAIDHAIRFTLQNSLILDQFIYPAEHVADPNNHDAATEPPMGTRFRLKSSVDISQLNPESKIIAQAMQQYGLILADNGSNFFVSGASESVEPDGQTLTWNDSDIQDTTHGLKSLSFSDFEVVDLTPQVTGLSESSGPAGSTLTVTGQNFSGAAGRLQVLFGNTAATNVTVVDDSHFTATVPNGTGTVDVRVQSGVTTPSDANNINNPIFGYGVSAVSANDKFTYAAANQSTWIVNVGDPGYAETGTGWSNGWGTDPAGDRYRRAAPVNSAWGATPSTATWSVSGLQAGTYEVYTTWMATPYVATNAPFTVLDGSKVLSNLAVNERQAPSDVTDGGRGWKSLGTFSVSSGTLAVKLTNNLANDTVVADAIRVVLISPTSNQPPAAANDTASTTAGTPVTINVLANDSDSDGDTLSVASVSQPAHGTAAVNADNTITYTPAAGFTGSDTFQYTVSDGRGGTSIASVAVTVASSATVKWVVNVGDAGYAETGTGWSNGWGTDPAGDPYRLAGPVNAAWSAPSTATWSVSGLPSGTYEVYTTWMPTPYVATNAPFTVLDGSKVLSNVAVNEQQAPSDATDGGRGWKSLGTFSISSGTLAVQLTNNLANNTIVADAIRIVRIS